jgi:LacI family transcriptional regulator
MLIHELPVRDEWVVGDRTDRGRILPVFMLPESLPTAFVCNCDESAYKLLELLKEKGLRVPDDISLVGFADSVFSRISNPGITTVAVDVDALTRTAAETITMFVEQKTATPGSVVIPGKMIYRDSVKKI